MNLRDAPDVVDERQCIDALNVTFSDRGAVEQRDGFAEFTTAELTNRGASLEPYYESDGTKQLLVGCGTRLEALNTSGGIVASATALSDSDPWDFVRISTPNTEAAYAGNGQDTLRHWNGAAWTAPTANVDGTNARALPKAGFLCVQASDNRMVATGFETTTGGPNAATSSPSHVFFSEPGKFSDNVTGAGNEDWKTANNVILSPGDGEKIMAAVAWRELVFVFKETKFFVFYGNSVGSDGVVDFNYRPVDAGVGLASSRALAVAPEGVYFMSREGVYLTTGSEPRRVSDLITPIWDGETNIYFKSSTLNHGSITQAAMAWWDDRIYLAIPTGSATTNDRLLVYDSRYQWWSLWDIPAAAMCRWRPSTQEELVFAYASGERHIGRHKGRDSFSADDMEPAATGGTAITARWRSGWSDYNNSDVKTIRESKLWGQGSMTFGLSYDFIDSNAQEQTVRFTSPDAQWDVGQWDVSLWGPSATNLPYLVSKAVSGTVFSVQFKQSTLGETFSMHRAANHLREQKVPSTRQVDRSAA